jgi:AcrR family transcriptional regulator
VADIAKQARMSRSTFYDHFTDVHDLAAAACTDHFDELTAAAPTLGLYVTELSEPHKQTLPGLFTHVADNARLYRALLGPDGSAHVFNHLLNRMTIAIHVSRNRTENGPTNHADDPAEIPQDVDSAFLAGGLLGVAIDWLMRGCPGTPSEMAAATWPLIVRAS